jgi:hypothetical protein
MSDYEAYGFVCLGVVTGVVFPVLASAVRKYFPKGQSIRGLPDWLFKYLLLGGFGLITGLMVFAAYKQLHPEPTTNWYGPYLAGVGWEGTVDAIFRPKVRGGSIIPQQKSGAQQS